MKKITEYLDNQVKEDNLNDKKFREILKNKIKEKIEKDGNFMTVYDTNGNKLEVTDKMIDNIVNATIMWGKQGVSIDSISSIQTLEHNGYSEDRITISKNYIPTSFNRQK